MTNSFICIVCPRGCHLQIDDEKKVTGNKCIRGVEYARKEITAPERMVTSTVAITSSYVARLPVRTSCEVPKDKMLDVIQELNIVRVIPPVYCGDIILENVLGLPINIIATRSILK